MKLRMVFVAWALAVVAGAAAGCGYNEEEWQGKLREISDLQQQLADRDAKIQADEQRIAELGGERDRLQQQLQDLTTQADQLTLNLAEVQRLYDEAKRREEQQNARLSRFREVIAKFQALVSSGRLRVRIARGLMLVEMASSILFPSGSAELSDAGTTTLSELAAVLITIPDRNFLVAGHTDNVPISSGRYRDNWDLSTARAVTVTRFFQEMGVTATRLGAVGYGDQQPVADNSTDSGREQNRRIEIILMPNLDELPDMSSLEPGAQ